MEQIHVRETHSEVIIFLDRNLPDSLSALKEAAKILAREIIRVETNHNKHVDYERDRD